MGSNYPIVSKGTTYDKRLQRLVTQSEIVTTLIQVVTCYARSVKTQCLWFHGISLVSDEKTYRAEFEYFGPVRSLVLDRVKSQLLVAFSDIASANRAYIEFKEKRRKLNNASNISCDFCSEELLQSVLYDDIVKKHGLTRTEIQNNWSEIQNKVTFN